MSASRKLFHTALVGALLSVVLAQASAQGTGSAFDGAGVGLAIEKNHGEHADGVLFHALTPTGSVQFGREGVLLVPPHGSELPPIPLQFLNVSPTLAVEGASPAATRVNHIIGRDPARWRFAQETYNAVRYLGIAPGIDLLLEGTSRLLKGTYHVAAGADWTELAWMYPTAQAVELAPDGSLKITVAGKTVTEPAPIAWQVDERGENVAVRCAYRVFETVVMLSLGDYDRTKPLVIDPTIDWSTYAGGGGTDFATDVAFDGTYAYVTGYIHSGGYATCLPPSCLPWLLAAPATYSPYQAAYGGDVGDAFVMKIDATQSPPLVVFSTRLGGGCGIAPGSAPSGTLREWGVGIDYDDNGNIYVAGFTPTTDFPTIPASTITPCSVQYGILHTWVAQFDPNGQLLNSQLYDAVDFIVPTALHVYRPTGAAYVTGVVQLSSTSLFNGFVMCVDFALGSSTLKYITGFQFVGGTNGSAKARNLCIDPYYQLVHVVGSTTASNLNIPSGSPAVVGPNTSGLPTGGVTPPSLRELNLDVDYSTLGVVRGGFIESWDLGLSTSYFAAYLNPSTADESIPMDVAVGPNLELLVVGTAYFSGDWDAYLTTLTFVSGTGMVCVNLPFGITSQPDVCTRVDVSSNDRIYFAGVSDGGCPGGGPPCAPTTPTGMPINNPINDTGMTTVGTTSCTVTSSTGAYDGSDVAAIDGFVGSYDTVSGMTWLSMLGSGYDDLALGMAVNGSNVIVVGETWGAGFPVHQNICQQHWGQTPYYFGDTYGGNAFRDAFITNISDP